MTWPTKKLGEVCEKIQLRGVPIGSWPYIEIGDIDIENKSIIFKEKKSIKGAVIAPSDSILISRVRPTRGAIVYIDKDYTVSPAFTILKAKIVETSSKFLFYWLSGSRSFLTHLQKKQKGSNYPSVREKDILAFKIFIPPVPIQRKIVERLDAIKKTQGLNDKQIELAKELFQSLLNKELELRDKSWKIKRVKQVLSSEKFTVGKLKRSQYQKAGQVPIIDQGDNEIAGYSDNENLAYKDELPIVIYGDHTRIVKYADFPFIIGADGVKVLLPEKEIMIPKYLYYALQYFNVESRGYRRHFPILKERKIPIPPLATQQRVVKKLSAIQDYKKKLLEQKQKLQELFKSVLNKSFKGEI